MIWIVLVVLFIIFSIIIKKFFRNAGSSFDASSYRKKERIMNESEQALFINLQKVLGDKYIILSKVRIEDFVDVKSGMKKSESWSLRGRIKSRHIDFLICDQTMTKPLLAIELDGKSHNNLKRQERDRFVDELYRAIDLPIEHINVGGNFFELVRDLSNKLRN